MPRVSDFVVGGRRKIDESSSSEDVVSDTEDLSERPILELKTVVDEALQDLGFSISEKLSSNITRHLRSLAPKFGESDGTDPLPYDIVIELTQILRSAFDDRDRTPEGFKAGALHLVGQIKAIKEKSDDGVWSLPSFANFETVKMQALDKEFNSNLGIEMLDKTCRNCKGHRFVAYETQLRGNDEASTRILNCAKCGREYSRT